MANPHWFDKWEWPTWKADAAVRRLTAHARLLWFELLGDMHIQNTYTTSGTPESIARAVGCLTPVEVRAALDDLQTCEVADVTWRDDHVTLTSRRRLKAHKARQSNAQRQARYRDSRQSNADATERSKKLEVEKLETAGARASSELPMSAGKPELVDQSDYRRSFDQFWSIFPRKAGRGACWAMWDRMTQAERVKALEMAEAYADLFSRADENRRRTLWSAPTWLRDRHWEDDVKEWLLQAEVKL